MEYSKATNSMFNLIWKLELVFKFCITKMVQYNFKKITVVPPRKNFIDITLSRTQRQTPTVVHKGYALSRIRQFYMRKINTTRNIIGKISKDFLRPLKCGKSLYQCKHLKEAALGRMCTAVKKISPSLAYLEQISIAQQAALFHSIKSLFMNKPLVIVCKKTDLQPLEGLFENDMKLVMEMKAEAMKTVTQAGGPNEEVKNVAFERLLELRVDVKMKSKKMMDCLNRFHVAVPKPRDNKERSVCIPLAVLEARVNAAAKEKKLEKNLENENGGSGVYSASLKKHYILANDEWKEDILPEILDGHNFADFVDPDIKVRCEELEREEGLRLEEQAAEDAFQIDGHELTQEQKDILAQIRKKKALLIQEHRMKKRTAKSRPIVPRKFDKDRKFTTNRMGQAAFLHGCGS
ncbi:unnamed protein product [Miscanthus lutarioriparius]|uniref:NOG C-terminal domain-containing protein n=1 Tax=Miscanthus lutarioriparius TaxID=422564 RepID=A0A811N099_9POAL|nr:unnamed protein product [Miscanthus lutarioriparius]